MSQDCREGLSYLVKVFQQVEQEGEHTSQGPPGKGPHESLMGRVGGGRSSGQPLGPLLCRDTKWSGLDMEHRFWAPSTRRQS